MGVYRRTIRWVLLGRRDGLRAALRRRLGWFTWLDRTERAPSSAEPVGPPPGSVGEPPPAADRPGPTGEGDLTVPEGWIRVADLDEVGPGEVLEVLAGDRPLALANVAGTVYAVEGVCPHAGGPLGDGQLDGTVLTCPWHGWSWDVCSGRSLVDDQMRVPTVPVKVARGGIWVPPAP